MRSTLHYLFLTILLLFSGIHYSNAQYCNLGQTPTQAGFLPTSDSIPCIVQGQFFDHTLQFLNFTTVSVLGIEYLRIDSITNLPCGIRWSTNKQDSIPFHQFDQGEHGCVRFIGTTNDTVGQYSIGIYVSIKATGISNEIRGEYFALGQQYAAVNAPGLYLRVKDNAASVCPAVDTSMSAVFMTATCPTLDTIYSNTFGRVSGRVFYDSNMNGIEDTGDLSMNGHKVFASNGSFTATNYLGNYDLYTQPGNYNLSADTALSYTVTTSASVVPINVNIGSTATAVFGLAPVNPIIDAKIVATNTRFRPGFDASVWLNIINNGNTSISTATASYTYHDSMTLVSSSLVPSSVSGNTLSWSVSNLPPGYLGRIQLVFNLSPNVNLLDSTFITLAYIDSLSNEVDYTNNTDSLDIMVTGSYDPNDKTAFPTGDLSEAFVTSGEPLRYRIRFQNTGTDTAFNIVVRDTLDDTKFDVNSIQMLGASHNYNFYVEGGKHAVWEFNNILLPDSNVNEPLSHGYLMFDIDLKPGLAYGDEINNGAGIFFDFNPVVLTNIANSKVDFSVGIPELMNTIRPKVYPNPANNILYVELPEANSISIEVVDLSGRSVLQAKSEGAELAADVSALQAGIYLVRITDGQGNIANRKVLISK